MNSLLRNFMLLISVLILGGFITFVLNNQTPDVTDTNTRILKTFEINNLENNIVPVSFDEDIILHFWATWCAPCIEELPALYAYANKNPSTQIYAIAVQDNINKIKKFMKNKKLKSKNINIFLDPDWRITKKEFKIKKLPTTVFIQDRQIIKRIDGPVDWSEYIAFPTK